MKQRSQKNISLAFWLSFHGFLSLLSYTAQGHLPRDCNPHHGLSPAYPHPLLMRTIPPENYLQASFIGGIFSVIIHHSPFLDMCQVGKKKQKTKNNQHNRYRLAVEPGFWLTLEYRQVQSQARVKFLIRTEARFVVRALMSVSSRPRIGQCQGQVQLQYQCQGSCYGYG